MVNPVLKGLFLFIVQCAVCSEVYSQQLQGGFQVGFGKSVLRLEEVTGLDNNSMTVKETPTLLFGVALNYAPPGSGFIFNSGISMENKRFRFTHKLNFFPEVGGSVYLENQFREYAVPLIAGYRIRLGGSGFHLLPKAGIYLTYGGLRLAESGYDNLSYTGSDSLFFDFGAHRNSFKRRFSTDPYFAFSFLRQPETERIFEFLVSYRLALEAHEPFSYYANFRNSTSRYSADVSFKPVLSLLSASVIFYPGWFAFMKRGPLKDEEDEM